MPPRPTTINSRATANDVICHQNSVQVHLSRLSASCLESSAFAPFARPFAVLAVARKARRRFTAHQIPVAMDATSANRPRENAHFCQDTGTNSLFKRSVTANPSVATASPRTRLVAYVNCAMAMPCHLTNASWSLSALISVASPPIVKVSIAPVPTNRRPCYAATGAIIREASRGWYSRPRRNRDYRRSPSDSSTPCGLLVRGLSYTTFMLETTMDWAHDRRAFTRNTVDPTCEVFNGNHRATTRGLSTRLRAVAGPCRE